VAGISPICSVSQVSTRRIWVDGDRYRDDIPAARAGRSEIQLVQALVVPTGNNLEKFLSEVCRLCPRHNAQALLR